MKLLSLMVATILILPSALAAQTAPAAQPMKAPPAQTYPEIGAAEKACGKDKTVWFNPASGIYFASGNRFFGKTRQGGYACEDAASAAGYRSAKNRT